MSPATRPADRSVLVVGAGLGGLFCARELAARGVSTTLLDRKGSVGDAIHTTGIFVRRSLEEFALPREALGPPIRRVALLSPARRAVFLESERDEFRVGRMRPLYESLLADCITRGVRWLPGARYLGSEIAEGGSRAFLSREGVIHSVRAAFIVGADGAGSRVARDLSLSRNRRWIVGAEEVLADAPATGGPRLLCVLDPRLAPGYIAWMVYDGEETHLGVGGYPGRFDPARALQAFRSEVGRLVDLTGARVLERRGGRIPVGGLLPRVACARGLLVGDSAGGPSPLTAGGFDAALRLARRAAQVVEGHLRGDRTALARYPGRSLERPQLWPHVTRSLIAAARSPLLLEAACGLLRVAPFKAFAERVFFGKSN